ncbi:MAG: aminopeptidase [Gaiellaceae bacterium]
MNDEMLARYARLVVETGANIQRGQVVWIIAEPRAAPFARAIAAAAYDRGARFVDPWYFDPEVKRIRLEGAPEESLDFVPSWYGQRLLDVGEQHGSRISITPVVPPGLLDGIDSGRAGKDQLPSTRETFDVINARTTNWCVVPWVTPEWARLVHPGLDDDAAVAALWEQLVFMLRLDEADPAAAWTERFDQLHDAGRRLDAQRFDALHFEGPGTDLTVGLLPTSRFSSETPGMQTVDGTIHFPNLPSEEIASAPDPFRVDGVVTATKPLDVSGTVIEDLRIRFEGGRAIQIEGQNADVLRSRCATDAGAQRLGEVALVDREGRIGQTDTVYFNTLLDENAASHLAFGNAYAISVGEADRERINTSAIHIDFMIGSNDVAVTGVKPDGTRVPVLRDGSWQLETQQPG